MSAADDCRADWRRCLPAAGAAGEAACDRVLARWSEPHRRYHALGHLAACLARWRGLQDRCLRPDLVGLALFYHDAVYDPRRGDNEARSANLAREELAALGVPGADALTVAALVLATAHGATVPDGDAALLCDIDLAVLAADAPGYDRYVAGVRAEYAHVDAASWRTGRATVLRAFLGRTRIFATATFADAEAAARANLARELAALV